MRITEDFKFKAFRKDFTNAVKSIEEQYGVDLSIGNITFDPDNSNFHTKMTVLGLGEGEDKDDVIFVGLANDFKTYFHTYIGSLNASFESMPGTTKIEKPEDVLGKKFKHLSAVFTFVGIKTRNRKAPFIFEKSDGSCIKCNEHCAANFFKNPVA